MSLLRKLHRAAFACGFICAVSAGTPDRDGGRSGRNEGVTALDILGSAENVDLVANAPVIYVERVSVPSRYEVRGWRDGRPVLDKVKALGWDEKRELRVDQGPLPLPDEAKVRLKRLLTRTYPPPTKEGGIASPYIPTYRFTFANPVRRLQVLVIEVIDILVVYQDGKAIGHAPRSAELLALVAELGTLLAKDESSGHAHPPSGAARHR